MLYTVTYTLEERREEATARAEGRALRRGAGELVDRRLRIRLARPQYDVGEVRAMHGVREVLALEAEAGPFPVGDTDGRRALRAVAAAQRSVLCDIDRVDGVGATANAQGAFDETPMRARKLPV